MTRVYIIMGTFNGEKRVVNSIESILSQSYTDFEFIICDDSSKDKTHEILIELSKKDTRLKILKNSSNMKLAYTLNRCLEVAEGEYVARMDDDDYSLPNRIMNQVYFLDSNPSYDIVGTQANIFDENGIYGKKGKSGEITIIDILKGNSFIHPSVMIRKKKLLDVDSYTDTIRTLRTEDLDLWFKLYKHGSKGFVIEEPLLNYFESIGSMKKRKYKYRINEYNIRKAIFKHFNISLKYKIFVYKPLIIGLIPYEIIKFFHSMSKRNIQ